MTATVWMGVWTASTSISSASATNIEGHGVKLPPAGKGIVIELERRPSVSDEVLRQGTGQLGAARPSSTPLVNLANLQYYGTISIGIRHNFS